MYVIYLFERVLKNGNAETQWIIARKELRTGL